MRLREVNVPTSENPIEQDLYALRAAFSGIDLLLKEAERIQTTKLSFGKGAFKAWQAEVATHWETVLDVQKRRGGAALEKQIRLVDERRQRAAQELERYVVESKIREDEARALTESRRSLQMRKEKASRTAAQRVLDDPDEWDPDYSADRRVALRREAVAAQKSQMPEEGRPKPNMHWIGLQWTEIRGESHVVTPVKLTFCGLGADGGERGYTAPVCYECGAFARMEPSLRSERLPTRVAEAIKRWESTQARRRSGRSSSVRSVSGGLPSMGKRYS